MSGGFSSARRSVRQQRCDLHEVVGEHGRRDPQLEALAAFGETALHAATAEQHRDAALDTCAKALAVLELPGLLIGLTLGCFGAAPLWDAHHLDALLLARRHVPFAEETAIRSIQLGHVAEGLLVAFQRNNHVLFVDGISVQYVILRDKAARAFGKEDLVPKFDRRLGLTPKKYQSGQTDYTGRISRHGDASAREALYEAAHLILTKPIKGCSELKSWAMRIARRAGANKAKVALARKLAVIMLRMLKDNAPFNPAAKAATA